MDDSSNIPVLFGDPPESPVLHYERMNLEQVRQQVADEGYAVVKGLVPLELISRVRDFWIKTFSNTTPTSRVTWSPYIGQESHVGFSSDKFQHLFRACDFLWNDPLHAETRDICLRVNALRNVVINEDPLLGIRFGYGRYGIFVTASYYPGGEGYMQMHADGGTGNVMLVHSLVPITFKGKDYKEGGMLIVNRKGQEVDVDSQVEPGDAIFYDGSLKHAVMPVVSYPGQTLGRLQIFPIPAIFSSLDSNIRALAKIPTARFIASKWFSLKNKLRITFGFNPSLR